MHLDIIYYCYILLKYTMKNEVNKNSHLRTIIITIQFILLVKFYCNTIKHKNKNIHFLIYIKKI